jgi:cell division protease FtsH
MYLCNQLPGRTTVILSGQAAPALGRATAMARALQPSMVVLEDVDLVAQDRELPHQQALPLLFQLLNEMDGMAEDADVIFVLTTNRVDLLEHALIARPGRVDQAVEIPLPDDDGRRRLIGLYLSSVDLDEPAVAELVARTSGASASLFKELGRRTVLLAAEQADPLPTATHALHALADLVEHSAPVLQRSLGLQPH